VAASSAALATPVGARDPAPPPVTGAPLDIGVFGARGIPSTYSGYETFLTTLLPRLADRGHSVTIYCRRGEVGDGSPFRGVRRAVLPAVPGKQLNTLSHGVVAAAQARRAGHDVVLVVNVANALICALNTATGQRVVLNTDGQEWLRGKWGRVARSFFRLSARASRHVATALVSDCAAMAEVYAQEFGATSTVIPYCFPAASIAEDPTVLDPFGVEPGRYYATGGRLNPENNVDAIAAAYVASEARLPLLVLGTANYDSPVQRRLDHLASRDGRVRLAGHVRDRRTFLTLLARAAAYAHGHSVGGMNPSLVEAMGAGALVAALDTPFNRETLGDTGSYFSPDCSDVVVVLECLRRSNPEEHQRRREAARSRVHEVFAVDAVVGAYEDLLTAVARGSRRRGVRLATRWSP
jgi:glycosyltransferase involved in cell wall biosynthesis